MGEVDFRFADISTGGNPSPIFSESGSPCGMVSSDFTAALNQEVKKGGKGGGGKKGGQGEKNKKQNNNAGNGNAVVDQTTPFFRQYRAWYFNYHNEELKTPRFNKQDLNLETLWNAVKSRGGSQETTNNHQWAEIGRQFNPPKSMTNVSYHIKRLYEKYLLAYEKSVSPHTAMEWRRPPGATKAPTSSPKNQTEKQSNQKSNSSKQVKTKSSENIEFELAQSEQQHTRHFQSQKQRNRNSVEFMETVIGGDEQLVGTVIRLWIARKNDYEVVQVVSYDPRTKAHTIRFSTGILNAVFLSQHTWSVCPEDLQTNSNKSSYERHSAEEEEEEENESGELDLQFLTPVDAKQIIMSTQQPLNLLQPTFTCKVQSNQIQQDALYAIDNEDQMSGLQSINTLSSFHHHTNSSNTTNYMDVQTDNNNNYAPLVSSLQIQLEQAQQRIERLEAQDRARKQEQETMRLQFAVREQQLQLMIEQMTIISVY
eukprot:TRINITY_DN2657_c0_g3_i3.p1 TRINITY_DN2657_c0_g3~~TRINITY_DN2657_c0_g3_i3.p1  ORF type:complete len:482 (+),score=82.53 TRINITY_DN2657_c0_g3_i3:150-1595(+)